MQWTSCHGLAHITLVFVKDRVTVTERDGCFCSRMKRFAFPFKPETDFGAINGEDHLLLYKITPFFKYFLLEQSGHVEQPTSRRSQEMEQKQSPCHWTDVILM